MPLEEWTDTITRELEADGYAVLTYEGLPLVARPSSGAEFAALLRWKGSQDAEKHIYGQGVIFVPPRGREPSFEVEAHAGPLTPAAIAELKVVEP